ncbi:hypothetical protein [Lactobacillus phage JNU_P1]|nr:hypothetical protein [Lactobacillus phage JNU_P1]
MNNNNYEVQDLIGTLSGDIERDFKKVISIFKAQSSVQSSVLETDIVNSLRQMHDILYVYRSICNDLLLDKHKDAQTLFALNYHLLITTLIFILKNDEYATFFLLRGSLEASIKATQHLNGCSSTNSFSNNLEQITKKLKNNLIIGNNINSKKRNDIKKSINKFTKYGREELYGSLSNKIHIREDINSVPSVYLNNFFGPISSIKQELSSLFAIIVEYETVFTMLNINALRLNKISNSKIEYFRSKYTNFKYLINLVMKLL